MISFHSGFFIAAIVIFIIMTVGSIFVDIIMHRHDKPLSLKRVALWSFFWIMMTMCFAWFLYIYHGAEIASLFLTAYALEEVLSVDNLFVIMAIFVWFGVPNKYRYRVLYWGVIGAVIFRGIFVTISAKLLDLGPYVEVLFAIIVSCTAIMMLKSKDNHNEIEDYSQHLAYRLVKSIYPIWPKISSNAFFLSQKEVNQELSREENQNITIEQNRKSKRYATPLLLCVVAVELSDIIFAFDSVPAMIAVSREPLVIYSAMMFAVFGQRTLYFLLEALKQYLIHLEKAVILLLFFMAFKLALNSTDHFWHHGYNISATMSLFVVLGVLVVEIIMSMIFLSK